MSRYVRATHTYTAKSATQLSFARGAVLLVTHGARFASSPKNAAHTHICALLCLAVRVWLCAFGLGTAAIFSLDIEDDTHTWYRGHAVDAPNVSGVFPKNHTEAAPVTLVLLFCAFFSRSFLLSSFSSLFVFFILLFLLSLMRFVLYDQFFVC